MKKLLHWQQVGEEVVVELVVLMVGVDEKVEQQQLVEEALRPGMMSEAVKKYKMNQMIKH